MRQRIKRVSLIAVGALVALMAVNPAAYAQNQEDSGFSIEVNPSPLVATVKPGEKKQLELRLHNNNTVAEQLKLELRSFDVDPNDGAVSLRTDKPGDVVGWVTFEQPTFTIKSGEWVTQKINVNTPQSAGFTYYFAIVVSRQNPKPPANSRAAIEGSVAVFTLLNVDKPGATSKIDVVDLTTERRVYEYLPAKLTLKLKNSGNTLARPGGNTFIQRTSNDAEPEGVIPINPNGSYLLPGVTRTFPIEWNDGFPKYVITQEAANVQPKQHLEWNWGKSKVRIGRYVARVVTVYNDGQRDIPVQAEIGFWVIPWKIILGFVLALTVLLVGIIAIARYGFKITRRGHGITKR